MKYIFMVLTDMAGEQEFVHGEAGGWAPIPPPPVYILCVTSWITVIFPLNCESIMDWVPTFLLTLSTPPYEGPGVGPDQLMVGAGYAPRTAQSIRPCWPSVSRKIFVSTWKHRNFTNNCKKGYFFNLRFDSFLH